jgi:hypothetical protein
MFIHHQLRCLRNRQDSLNKHPSLFPYQTSPFYNDTKKEVGIFPSAFSMSDDDDDDAADDNDDNVEDEENDDYYANTGCGYISWKYMPTFVVEPSVPKFFSFHFQSRDPLHV